MMAHPLLRGAWIGLLGAAVTCAVISVATDRPGAMVRAIAYLLVCCLIHRPAWRAA